jgi:hypothetical protein
MFLPNSIPPGIWALPMIHTERSSTAMVIKQLLVSDYSEEEMYCTNG